MADCQIRCRIKGIDYIGNLDLNNFKKSGTFKDIYLLFLIFLGAKKLPIAMTF